MPFYAYVVAPCTVCSTAPADAALTTEQELWGATATEFCCSFLYRGP